LVKGGPVGAWRGRIHICKRRARRGVKGEGYINPGRTDSGCGGGRGVFP